MYHESVVDRLLSYIRKHDLMRPGDRVGVAVSGGADSVALLRLLLEVREQLGIVLSVVHFNHRIRGSDADADEAFVRDLARNFDLEFHCDSADTPAYAAEHKLSLEAAGRKLRYGFFDRLTADRTVFRVATAHTRDDQAETVLMRFLRGAGTKGMAGIYPGLSGWISGASADEKPAIPSGLRIIRPLLEFTRAELRTYLQNVGQSWREDASNLDVNFARNRLRHEIMPVLRQLNPNLDQVLSETAEIARDEESWWKAQTNNAINAVWVPAPDLPPGAPRPLKIRVDSLLALPVALQRRVVRTVFPETPLDFSHVEAVLALAAGEPSRKEKAIELPDGWEAVRGGQELWFQHRCRSQQERREYHLPLCVPGEVEVVGRMIRAALLTGGEVTVAGGGARATKVLLDPGLAKSGLAVRNWRAGDRYQPAHSASPKKLKELLQAPHIARAQKPFWPVVVSGDEIVWVPGFAPPEKFQVRHAPALLLEEVPVQREGKKGP